VKGPSYLKTKGEVTREQPSFATLALDFGSGMAKNELINKLGNIV